MILTLSNAFTKMVCMGSTLDLVESELDNKILNLKNKWVSNWANFLLKIILIIYDYITFTHNSLFKYIQGKAIKLVGN